MSLERNRQHKIIFPTKPYATRYIDISDDANMLVLQGTLRVCLKTQVLLQVYICVVLFWSVFVSVFRSHPLSLSGVLFLSLSQRNKTPRSLGSSPQSATTPARFREAGKLSLHSSALQYERRTPLATIVHQQTFSTQLRKKQMPQHHLRDPLLNEKAPK